jgi:hypothetical protein
MSPFRYGIILPGGISSMVSQHPIVLTIGLSRLPHGLTLWNAANEVRAFVNEHAPKRCKVKYTAPLIIDVVFENKADEILFVLNYRKWLSTADEEMALIVERIRAKTTVVKPRYEALSFEDQKRWVDWHFRAICCSNLPHPMGVLVTKIFMTEMGWIQTTMGWQHPESVTRVAC